MNGEEREMLLLIIRALEQGYTFSRVSLYDEEGVPGWRWDDPQGFECGHVIGEEWPPDVPERIADALQQDIARGAW